MNRRMLVGYEEKLGEDHPSTLTSVSNLAYLLELLHRNDEAASLYERASRATVPKASRRLLPNYCRPVTPRRPSHEWQYNKFPTY